MKILAFAASNSRVSINKQLVSYAVNLLETGLVEDAVVEVIDLNDFEMPIYSIDREQADGIPMLAQQFYQKITAADALLIAYAEHNGLYTVAFKNIYDWMSRIDIKIYQNKPVVMLATSPGPGGGQRVLAIARDSADHFGANLKATLSVPSFYDHFDTETGSLTGPALHAELSQALQCLAQ